MSDAWRYDQVDRKQGAGAYAPRNGIALRFALAILVSFELSGLAFGKDGDDGEDQTASKPSAPQVYLDLRSYYSRVPPGMLSIGLGNPSAALSQMASLASLPSPSLPASQGVGFDVPLTVDLNDRLSLYGGFSATASKAGDFDWTALAVTSWNVGLQADIYQQNGGAIPTLTVQSTLTRTVPSGPLAATALNTILEATYALNADETRGFLAGVQSTLVAVDSDFASVRPNWVGWLGGFYQWENNWKATARAGLQSFGGAQLLTLAPIEAFTQPILRLDLDRMDDNDNRLFGVTAQIAWTPKPAYQLTVRTPLYLTKN